MFCGAGLLPFRIGHPVGEVIGEGGFGVVRKAVLADGSLVAIKTIRCRLKLQCRRCRFKLRCTCLVAKQLNAQSFKVVYMQAASQCTTQM